VQAGGAASIEVKAAFNASQQKQKRSAQSFRSAAFQFLLHARQTCMAGRAARQFLPWQILYV